MEEQEDEEEKEKPDYFYRLICLVVDLGTEVLLKLFLKDIPQGQTVEAFLNSKANVLDRLKNKKVFNDLQIGILNAASPDVSRFDISLLYILISNLTNLQSPIGGWYIACPIPSDPSAGALLMNLKRVRHEAIAHWPRGKMKKSDFEKYWNEAKDILIELAGEDSQAEKESVKAEIDRIKMKQLGDMGNKLETLLLWARQDQYCEILFSIEELKQKIDQHGRVLGDIAPIKSSIQAVEAQINTTSDQHRRDIEEIKTSIRKIENRRPAKDTSKQKQIHSRDMFRNRDGGDGEPVTTNKGGQEAINIFGGYVNISGNVNIGGGSMLQQQYSSVPNSGYFPPQSNQLSTQFSQLRVDQTVGQVTDTHDQMHPLIRGDDSALTSSNFAKASSDYIELLNRIYCI